MTIESLVDRMWRAAILAKEGAPDIEVEKELERAAGGLLSGAGAFRHLAQS